MKGEGKMKTFKAITKDGKSEYVDWYKTETLEEAKELWEKDRKEFGLPETVTVEITEVKE